MEASASEMVIDQDEQRSSGALPVKYNITDEAIAKMRTEFMALTCVDTSDMAAFSRVHESRMVVKNHRVAVEKRRKELKADALEYGKRVDAEAKRITSLLIPIEEHLAKEEAKVVEEQARVKAEKERKKQEQIQSRIDLMAEYGQKLTIVAASTLTDDEFLEILDKARATWLADQARLEEEARIKAEQEEAARKELEAEAARLAAIKAEQDRIAAEQAAREAAIKADQDRIAEEQARIEAEKKAKEEAERKAEETERNRIAAEAKAKADAEERARREAAAKAEAERLAAEEAARVEALKPDNERLKDYAARLLAVSAPALNTDEAKDVLKLFQIELIKLTATLVV